MGLMGAYLMTTKNMNDFFNAIVSARAPERFTNTFLKQLEFTSSNDRLYIGVLKGLGFLEDSGAPTQRYFNFLDQTQSGVVLAEAIKEAYSDLFAVNKKANNMSVEEVKNKLKTLTQGQKSDNVVGWMANTFKALCDYAEWDKLREHKVEEHKDFQKEVPQEKATEKTVAKITQESAKTQLHYNIQIHLPESRDIAVYDAIFRSLKEHLL